jgi:thiol-disulfide isomerase/thioredoxin
MPMDPIGIVTVVVVLVVGTAAGIWRSRTSGRLHEVRATGSGRLREVRATGSGRPRQVRSAASEPGRGHEAGSEGERLDPVLLAGLGVEPGARGTLLQFSSAYCAPCRAVRRVSAEVAVEIPGVRHVEVDAETHLDAVRALGIWRTPTLLVLDGQGRVTKRATGVPSKPHLIAALEF